MEKVEKSKIKFGYEFQRICSRRTENLNKKQKTKHSTNQAKSRTMNRVKSKMEIGPPL